MRIGSIVTLKGKKTTATIIRRLSDVRGGVVLDKPLGGFRYWNIADLEKKHSHG